MEHPWQKDKIIRIKKGLMTTNKCPLWTKSATESRPWGVTAWGAGASYKLHGGGMIMCKQTKEKTNSWILQCVGDRRINMLCCVSKGISLFFCSFRPPHLLKIFLDGWNVSGIHSTLQTGRLESRSNDYCLAHPGLFFFSFSVFFLFVLTTLLPHWQERHWTKQEHNNKAFWK